MLEVWILILIYAGDGKAIAMHEFNSRETCESAGKVFSDSASWSSYRSHICVKK